jgi:hypothetical protein
MISLARMIEIDERARKLEALMENHEHAFDVFAEAGDGFLDYLITVLGFPEGPEDKAYREAHSL